MRLIIAAIGKLRAGSEAALIADYAARAANIGRNIGFSGPEILEFEAPRGLAGASRQAREGALLLDAAPEGAALVCLDERGRQYDSEAFSQLLGKRRDDGVSAMAFLIGGADGHNAETRARATQISFGAATWPHMLVRVMLCEQLYRTMTILSGHPYHRS